jgi:hypothetical protein
MFSAWMWIGSKPFRRRHKCWPTPPDTHHLPDLQHFIFTDGRNYPIIHFAPAEISNLIRVPAVDKLHPNTSSGDCWLEGDTTKQQNRTNSSGGPSSTSSGTCWAPIFDRSHTFTRRSADEVARIWVTPHKVGHATTSMRNSHTKAPRTDSLKGAHCTEKTSSMWDSNECSLLVMLRRSHRAAV